MKQTITKTMFINTFRKLCPDNFSYDALIALFDYYEDAEKGTEIEIEFDPIAICCGWTEYDSIEEASEAYGLDVSKSDEEMIENLIDQDMTVRKLGNGGVIIFER